jgi:hypothetical protein
MAHSPAGAADALIGSGVEKGAMSWLGGLEVVLGLGALALAMFLVGVFRLAPGSGETGAPSATRLSIIPVVILLIAVCGVSLILVGLGLR